VTLRALFPNPDRLLLPGMFVREQIVEGRRTDAILVPQLAVTHDQKGDPTALIVNADNKVELRPVVTDRAIGDMWLVSEGLKAGERVVVEGLQFAHRAPPSGGGGRPRTGEHGGIRPAAGPLRLSRVVNFFIDRPIFAWVIAIVIMLGGALAVTTLPVARTRALPPGDLDPGPLPGCLGRDRAGHGDAGHRAAMSGIDHLIYFSSESDKDGSMTITLFFEQGTDRTSRRSRSRTRWRWRCRCCRWKCSNRDCAWPRPPATSSWWSASYPPTAA
jgi:hypothetical protein